MWVESSVQLLQKFDRPLVNLLKNIAMAILAAMMFLTAADVFLRYIFNRPIAGSYEIVEYLMGMLVSFSVTYCEHEKAHISVDVFLGPLSKKVRVVLSFVTTILAFVFFLLITWQAFLYIKDEFGSHLTSAVLLIPVYPFIATVAVAFAVLCLVLLVHVLSLFVEVRKEWTR